MTPSGIESATFRLVAQCLNRLRNRVPLKEKRGWWELKEEALYHTPWIARFVRVCGLVGRQTGE
jgi:hypothetical protein